MPEASSRPLLGFRTLCEWRVDDLQLFCEGVRKIYDGLLVAHISARLAEEAARVQEDSLRRFSKMADGPFMFEYSRFLLEMARAARRSGIAPIPGPLGVWPYVVSEMPSPDEFFENLVLYSQRSEHLRVHRIRMTSPGGFSFDGLGEIVKEFRELVKDLWYRNRQERDIGRFDIISKYLKLRQENPNVDLPVPRSLGRNARIVKEIDAGARTLEEHEKRGLLESVPDNLDYVPE